MRNRPIEKMPVTKGLDGFIELIERYPEAAVCPYVADKTPEGWDRSTSRVYMNQVLENFIYVPVNIAKGDTGELQRFLERVQGMDRVAAINITQPHKSATVIKAMFLGDAGSDQNVDTLIRDAEGKLAPFDLNAPAFVGWYKDEVGSFEGKTVVLVGVGGVGEPIAKKIAGERPGRLELVDPIDKSNLAERLGDLVDVKYHISVTDVDPTELPNDVIVINAAGKEGAGDDSGLVQLLTEKGGGVFIDIRPQLQIPIGELAEKHGWTSYTGHGMNARNDYELLEGIAGYLGAQPPVFEEFQKLVKKAS